MLEGLPHKSAALTGSLVFYRGVQKKLSPAKTAGGSFIWDCYSMAMAVEAASFFTSSFGTMTLRTPSSYFALTSSGLTLPT